MYRNSEYYPDPTAGAALRQLYRKEKDLNTGKQFEADWKKSMPPDAWCYRLKDSAASYYGGNESLSFSIDNICDFDVYRYPMHHYFELKTIETPSIPLEKILGRFDRDKQKYHKLKHITDMAAAAAMSVMCFSLWYFCLSRSNRPKIFSNGMLGVSMVFNSK